MYKHLSCAALKIKLTTGSGTAGTCEKLHDPSRIRIGQKVGVCKRPYINRPDSQTRQAFLMFVSLWVYPFSVKQTLGANWPEREAPYGARFFLLSPTLCF
jgi:hypothetical protein